MRDSLKVLIPCACIVFSSCDNYYRNDYKDNSPTSGRLKIYYDEGLHPHVKNQVFTFESLYPNTFVDLVSSSESDALRALLDDSCEVAVISRLPGEEERRIFESRNYFPKYSAVAMNGVALITNINTPVTEIREDEITHLLTGDGTVKDGAGNRLPIKVLFDGKNSGVLHYMLDSVTGTKQLASHCNVLGSTPETINYVAANRNTIAFIDFAWLSDTDDSLYIANKDKIKFVGIVSKKTGRAEYPSQSSFKLGDYPFARTVYIIRKTGDNTLAKGFESFVAGPKGQLTFLKQGLMPTRQRERTVNIKIEP
jgi:phosphate transport system substrate-binding protein